MPTENIIILYDIVSDGAVLAGGDWLPALPLQNLQTERLKTITRSAGLDLADTQFTVALPFGVPVLAVALDGTNLSALAKYRVRAYSDAGFTAGIFDTGWKDVVEPMPFGVLAYGDPHLYDGLTEDRGRHLTHIFDGAILARYWRVEIDDRTNPDGYIDAGRLVISRFLNPRCNFNYGAGFSYLNNSQVATTLSGGKVIWTRQNPRSLRVNFEADENEITTKFSDLNDLAGYGGQVFVIPEPSLKDGRRFRRAFLATIAAQDALAYSAWRRGTAGYTFEEVII